MIGINIIQAKAICSPEMALDEIHSDPFCGYRDRRRHQIAEVLSTHFMFPGTLEVKRSREERPDDLKSSNRGISNGAKEHVEDHGPLEELIP